eukprot:TRINITY_DN19571_c0_g1_i1.p2 TRINITY_DN19571_c0_g1~~TRINITY_DN19571_c0_g1_i1.p2  ORF type:complete len:288 (+),score=99.30 TRINITY_DN19571_c0_g1_i1:101-865(+)
MLRGAARARLPALRVTCRTPAGPGSVAHGWRAAQQVRSSAAIAAVAANVAAAKNRTRHPIRPSLADAKAQLADYSEYPNEVLLLMATLGDSDARGERVIREIMRADEISWEDAHKIFVGMQADARDDLTLFIIPYKLGILLAITLGLGSIPMCFHYPTVDWFNKHYVTTDVPEPEDLETWLEVGSWSWNWMEPPLGQISFMLLCLAYARSHYGALGYAPYNRFVRNHRTNKFLDKYPRYNQNIVREWVQHEPLQ